MWQIIKLKGSFFWRSEPLHKQNCCSEIAARQSPREIEGWGCTRGEGKEDWRWWNCEPHIQLRRFTISPNPRKVVKDALWRLLTMIKREKKGTFKLHLCKEGLFSKMNTIMVDIWCRIVDQPVDLSSTLRRKTTQANDLDQGHIWNIWKSLDPQGSAKKLLPSYLACSMEVSWRTPCTQKVELEEVLYY